LVVAPVKRTSRKVPQPIKVHSVLVHDGKTIADRNEMGTIRSSISYGYHALRRQAACLA
jgi:hypothetical protein